MSPRQFAASVITTELAESGSQRLKTVAPNLGVPTSRPGVAQHLSITGDPAKAGPRTSHAFADTFLLSPPCPHRRRLTTSRCFNRRDIDLLHRHHGLEGALGFVAAGCQRIQEHARRD